MASISRTDDRNPPDGPAKRRGYVKAIIVGVGLMVVLAAHPVWLTQAARFLSIEDPLKPAEMIIVLGGYVGMKHAAELYHQGYGPRLLIPIGPSREWIFGYLPDPIALAQEQAQSLGIPLQHLIMHRTTRKPADAWARELLATLHAQGVKSAIVIGPPFQMRRMALLFDMVFADGGVELTYHSPPPEAEEISSRAWWTRREGLFAVQNEYLSLVMWVLKYRLGILREHVVEGDRSP